ncbi:MAG: hypothetical protein GY861_09395 [bacterium]|nr:hypothetical protein [bacterium]
MRRTLFFLALFLILLNFSSLVDAKCQYETIEEYDESGNVLTYEGTDIIAGEALNISDFSEGNHASFMVYNPNSFKLMAVFNFTVDGFIQEEKSYGKWIDPLSFEKVQETCYNGEQFGNCSINQSTLFYYVSKPEVMFVTEGKIKRNRTLCDKSCSSDGECGFGVCNINGYCGNEKIVPCSSGTQNCQNLSCETPGAKKFGEAFSCVWECKSGVGSDGICKLNDKEECSSDSDCFSGMCNIAGVCGEFVACPNRKQKCNDELCVFPSVKKVGQAYSCEWECKSGVGEDGVCKESFMTLVKRFILFTALIALIIALTIFLIKRATGEGPLRKLRKQINELEKQREEKKQDFRKAEIKLKKQWKSHEISKGDLNKRNEELTQEAQEMEDISILIELNIKKVLSSYEKMYGHPFVLDGRGYVRFAKDWLDPSKMGGYLHHHVWKINNKGKEKPPGYEIHHKDGNKLNNSIENLELLTEKEHMKKHGKF